MAKELIYKVRIDYDSSDAASGAQIIENTQEDAADATNKTTQALRRQEEAQESASQASRSYQRNQSRANQVLFSYGDLLNDAQQFQFGFSNGLRAIGNNVGFAAEGISNLTTKAGGFRGALSALGSSLIGPGGLILGLNLAVTALTVFGDKLFGGSDSVASKAKKARKELEDVRKELNRFETQFEQLTRLQEQAFPDLEQEEALRQQVQFATELEANLQNRLDAQNEEIERLERQVELFEGLSDGSTTYNEALRQGLISQRTAEAIAQGRVDIQGTLIKFQNNLNDAKIQQESLETSVQSAQERQINLNAKLLELVESQNTQSFQALQNLIKGARQLESIDAVQRIALETAAGDTITPGQQEQIEARREEAQKTQQVLNEIATKTVPSVSESITDVALRGIEITRQQAELTRDQIMRISTVAEQAGQAISLLFGQSKAAAIASAIVNGAQAITRTFAQYGFTPFGIAAAASQAAITAAQIAKIKSTDIGGAGNGASQTNATQSSVGQAQGTAERTTVGSRSIQGVQSQQKQVQPIVIQGDVNAMGAAFTVREGEAKIRNRQEMS